MSTTPAGYQVRSTTPEGPGPWRHADEQDLPAYVRNPEAWEVRPVFAEAPEPIRINRTTLAQLQALADAVQQFRNERLLARLSGLRGTKGYCALVNAWDDAHAWLERNQK